MQTTNEALPLWSCCHCRAGGDEAVGWWVGGTFNDTVLSAKIFVRKKTVLTG